MHVVIVDDEVDIQDIYKIAIEFDDPLHDVQCFSGVNQAITYLQNKPKVDLIFCDYRMPEATGDKLLSWLLSTQSKVPFVLCSGNILKECIGIQEKDLFFFVQKPDIMNGIKLVFEKWKSQNVSSGVAAVEKGSRESDYHALRVRSVCLLDSVPVDLYIRLSESKFVKFWSAKDPLNNEDKDKFKKKAEFLWIQSQDLLALSQHFEKTLLSLASGKMNAAVLSHDDQFAAFFQDAVQIFPASPEVQKAAKIWIQQASGLLKNSPDVESKLKKILSQSADYATHVNLVTLLGLEILHLTKWTSEAAYLKISAAALFHDIGMSAVDAQKLMIFLEAEDLKHPIKSAEILKSMKELPPDVDRVVLEHHERPNGDGFPRALHAAQISPLGAVFNLSHELSALYQSHLPQSASWSLKTAIEKLSPEWREKSHYKKMYHALLENFK